MPLKNVSLVEVVAAELHRRIWHDTDAIGAVASHESSPTLFPPHFRQRLAHTKLVRFATVTLDLVEDFEAFEGRDYRSGYGTGNTAGAKGGHCGLGDSRSELVGGAHLVDSWYG